MGEEDFMQAIEIETWIDKDGHIYLLQSFDRPLIRHPKFLQFMAVVGENLIQSLSAPIMFTMVQDPAALILWTQEAVNAAAF